MTLVEDYLRAVALLLPKAQREDITAELRDVILSRMEGREAELGRRLTDDEIEAVLRVVGHPLAVAAGYGEGPHHVVGPTLYPYWMFGVKVALTLQAAIALVVFVARSLGTGNAGRAFGQALGSAISGSLVLIGVATLVAWAVERRLVQIGYLDRWRVRDLRGLEVVAAWDFDGLRTWAAPAGRELRDSWTARAVGRPGEIAGRALGAIASGIVLLMWWAGLFYLPVARDAAELREFGIDAGALAAVSWTGLKAALFWPGIAYCLALILQGAVMLLRPQWVRAQGGLNLLIGTGGLAVAAWLWSASPIAAHVQVGSLAAFTGRLREAFSGGPPFPLAPLLTLALACGMLGAVGRIVRGLWELVAGAPTRQALASEAPMAGAAASR